MPTAAADPSRAGACAPDGAASGPLDHDAAAAAAIADPSSLFRVSEPPSRRLSSVGSGWDGAHFVEVTAARAGEFHQVHDVVVLQRWLTPLCIRPAGAGDGGAAGPVEAGVQTWTTYPPAVWLRFPGDAQHGAWRGSTECQLLFITPARVEAVLGTPWHRSTLPRWREPSVDLPFVGEVLSALSGDIADGHPAGPIVGDALVAALLAHLDGRGVGSASPGPRALGRRIDMVLDYIEANLARPLRLAELADVACVRVRRLIGAFAAETGCPPHRYILRRRVERAKSLMRETNLSLAEIGLAVGFTDPSQFSKVFRRVSGQAPRAFRCHARAPGE